MRVRWFVPLAALLVCALLVCAPLPLCAQNLVSGAGQESRLLAQLQDRIQQSQPREQCFLYAQFAQQVTELSVQQFAAGNPESAATLLHQVQNATRRIHQLVAADNKKLKDAEILLRRASFRLTELLRGNSVEDRPLLEQTIAQLNQAENEAMQQVFRR